MNKQELIKEIRKTHTGCERCYSLISEEDAKQIIDLITKHNCQEAVEAVNVVSNLSKSRYLQDTIIRSITTRLMGESDEN
jgi:hypothetical protein